MSQKPPRLTPQYIPEGSTGKTMSKWALSLSLTPGEMGFEIGIYWICLFIILAVAIS